MKKVILSIFLIHLFASVVSVHNVYARDEFKSFCHLSYRFYDNGDASVSHEISLINQKPDIYISEYTLRLSGERAENIRAWDKVGPLKIVSTVSGETTKILLKFNEKVVGKDQTLSLVVKYDIPQLAKKEGKLWKIVLPRFSHESQPDSFSLEVKVPFSFGSLAFASLYPQTIERKDSLLSLIFEKEDGLGSGVLLQFGNYQVYDFNLVYHLENSGTQPVPKEITLPPDTAYQIVEYNQISPQPGEVVRDDDGNWIAKYTLLPNSRIEVKAVGKVKIFSSPIKKEVISKASLDRYLEAKIFWEKNDERINQLSKNLKSAEEIYRFVVNKLTYNYEKIKMNKPRLGALGALASSEDSLCLEFSDLFVALARAAGIPAREIEGFAYTDNPKLRPLSLVQDILHAWPEYYDFQSSSWRMVDPTWGRTTGGFDYFNNFDMSHFTFVIHGVDSQHPLPPGSFKFSGEEGKNIFINYGQETQFPKKNLEIYLSLKQPNILKKEVEGLLIIENRGSMAVYNFPARVKVNDGFGLNINEEIIPYLLPYGKVNLPIKIKLAQPFFKNIKGTVSIQVADTEKFEEVSIKFLTKKRLINITILFLSTSIIFVFILLLRKM